MSFALRLAAIGLVLAAAAATVAGQQASDASPAREVPESFQPKQPRLEADQDRVAAAAHELQGRLLYKRGDLSAALVHYQRAWRYDAGQTEILREIVSLAFELKRSDEAARYAVLAGEADPSDAVLLRRLAMYLTEQRDWRRALKLYEQSLALARRDRPDAPLDLAEMTIRFEMGRLHFLANQFARSAESFAKVRDALADPSSPLSAESKKVLLGKPERTYSLWAESFLEAKRYDEAAALFEKASAAKADAAELAFNLARVEAGRGNTAAALARLDEYFAAKASSAGAEPYELLADLTARTVGNPGEARKLMIGRLEGLRQSDPQNAPLAVALAGQYFQSQRLDDAERLFSAALTGKPTGEVYRRLVEIYRRQDQPDKLLTVAGMLAGKAGSLDALAEVGQAMAADGPFTNRLVERTRQLHKESPQSLPEGQLLAAALLARAAKQYDASDELLSAALPMIQQPGPGETLLQWGLALLAADEYERAAKTFRKIVDGKLIPGGEANTQNYLAAALELAGHTDDALAAARRANELSPANARFAAREPWVLYHAKRYDAAREAYQALIARCDARREEPSVRDVAREARLALASIEKERGDAPAAVEWLEQVLDEFPEDSGASNDLGYWWAERGEHLGRSLRMIERAVAAQPENKAYRDSLGWALFRLGRLAEAEKELAAAARGDAPDGEILDHWGDVLARLGRMAEAAATWRRAEAAFQKSGEPRKSEAVRAKITAAGQ